MINLEEHLALSKKIANDMKQHYSATFLEHGPTSEGVDWGTKADRIKTRLEKMAAVIIGDNSIKIRILDIGCGYGAFYEYLSSCYAGEVEYTGIDLCENMIKEAKKQHPHAKFIIGDFMDYDFGEEVFDYVICNGIFTQKLSASSLEMHEYLKQALQRMFNLCQKGFVFNIMSSYVNFHSENLFYFSPAELLSYLLSNVSQNVRLDHSYRFFEYSCYVYK